jgi:hypothetical protein
MLKNKKSREIFNKIVLKRSHLFVLLILAIASKSNAFVIKGNFGAFNYLQLIPRSLKINAVLNVVEKSFNLHFKVFTPYSLVT